MIKRNCSHTCKSIFSKAILYSCQLVYASGIPFTAFLLHFTQSSNYTITLLSFHQYILIKVNSTYELLSISKTSYNLTILGWSNCLCMLYSRRACLKDASVIFQPRVLRANIHILCALVTKSLTEIFYLGDDPLRIFLSLVLTID